MTVKLNDTPHDVPENTSMAAFIAGLRLEPQGIAVAVNYEVLPKETWADVLLSDNMDILLIQAVSGG
ncbi:Thiamine biosynthesis protein ThiS [Bacteroidales bacterium Barb4]|nr:Thiamine biosynthesis protein ThiS [Bacteroidales bacterium Barb4]